MFTGFEVIPAVDIRDGTVVQLVGGDPETGQAYGDPVATAERWVADGAATLHVVDLDGAIEGERRNADTVEAIVEAVDATVQVGGGIRSAEAAEALFAAGVDRVVLGTAAIENPAIVETVAATHPDGVMVSLDASAGEVLVEGWTEGTGLDPVAAARRYADLGAAAILFTDIDVEGSRGGVRTDPVAAMAEAVSIPVVASGGVATVEDLCAVRGAGAAACVVGTALYEEAFTLADAHAALDR
ncbi:MAG: 1-(5-phosphoribosyl)-5-[(5-phosphoribosylamino)methylideneamino]imidazole-4-carboxamide isomerase [Halobacteriaceae archaeon]